MPENTQTLNPPPSQSKENYKVIIGLLVALVILLAISTIYFATRSDDAGTDNNRNDEMGMITPVPTIEVTPIATATPSATAAAQSGITYVDYENENIRMKIPSDWKEISFPDRNSFRFVHRTDPTEQQFDTNNTVIFFTNYGFDDGAATHLCALSPQVEDTVIIGGKSYRTWAYQANNDEWGNSVEEPDDYCDNPTAEPNVQTITLRIADFNPVYSGEMKAIPELRFIYDLEKYPNGMEVFNTVINSIEVK